VVSIMSGLFSTAEIIEDSLTISSVVSVAATAAVVTPFTVMATMGSAAATVVGDADAAAAEVADFRLLLDCLLPFPRRRFHIEVFCLVIVGLGVACSDF